MSRVRHNPSNKQGVTDYMYTPTDGISMQQRYALLDNLGLGLKTYNLFWSGAPMAKLGWVRELEDSSPICPASPP